MNIFKQFKDNPDFKDAEERGDLWAAIHTCHTLISVVDERVRVALLIGLPVIGFLVAVQLVCLGVLVK